MLMLQRMHMPQEKVNSSMLVPAFYVANMITFGRNAWASSVRVQSAESSEHGDVETQTDVVCRPRSRWRMVCGWLSFVILCIAGVHHWHVHS